MKLNLLPNAGTEIHRPVTENQVVKMSTSFSVTLQGLLKIRCRDDNLILSVTESAGQNGPLKKPDELVGRDSQIFDRPLARSRSAEGAALCPSDMMLCVIYYWVLSGAKRRQIQQLRCCVLPRQAVETEGCLSEINTTQRTSRNPRHL